MPPASMAPPSARIALRTSTWICAAAGDAVVGVRRTANGIGGA
jgi:hypothetical protein